MMNQKYIGSYWWFKELQKAVRLFHYNIIEFVYN